jgi:hypothetical protein
MVDHAQGASAESVYELGEGGMIGNGKIKRKPQKPFEEYFR